MLTGIDAKSAILIVEFAKLACERGTPLFGAALEGACLRLRPIIMTPFAFILGCVPVSTVSGSGAAAGRVERFADRRGERAAQDPCARWRELSFSASARFQAGARRGCMSREN
jgi:hypothetical protein